MSTAYAALARALAEDAAGARLVATAHSAG